MIRRRDSASINVFLDTRLSLTRQHLEASVKSVAANDLFSEVKLLKIQRTELITEIAQLKEEIECLKKHYADNKDKKVVEDDHEYREALIEIFNHNLVNLKKEQELLQKVLEKNKSYVNQLQQDLISLTQYQASLQEQALKMEEYRIKTNFQKALANEFEKCMKVEDPTDATMKDDTSHADDEAQIELILADKFCYLESLQSMIDKTVQMNSQLAVSRKSRDPLESLDEEIEALKKEIEVASELQNNSKASESGTESEDCDAEIDEIVDNVLQDENLIIQDSHSDSKLEASDDEINDEFNEEQIKEETLYQNSHSAEVSKLEADNLEDRDGNGIFTLLIGRH